MTKTYEIQYWEQEAVWCRRTIELPTDKNPKEMTPEELKKEIEENEDINWLDGDYNYETAKILDYDFETDFIVEEVNND